MGVGGVPISHPAVFFLNNSKTNNALKILWTFLILYAQFQALELKLIKNTYVFEYF